MSRRCKGFKLTKVERPSGSDAWLVSGTLNGKQLKREFESKAEAIAEQDKQNALLFGHAETMAPVMTRLSGRDVEHAETVLAQLEKEFPGVTLFEVLAYFRTVSPVLSPYTADKFNTAFKGIVAACTASTGASPRTIKTRLAEAVKDGYLAPCPPRGSYSLGKKPLV